MRIALKRLFAFSLIIGSIIFAVLIFTDKTRVTYPLSASLPAVDQPIRSENLSETSADTVKNLTEEAARKINEEMSSYDAEDLKDPGQAEKIAEKYLAEAIQNFDFNSLRPAVATERLKIVSVFDQRLLSIYIKGFNDALNSAFGGLSLDGIDSQKQLEILSLAYAKSIEALYAMTIPQIFGLLHEKIIANLSGQKLAAEIIRQNYQTDPMRALFALQAIEQFNQELKTVQKNISDLADKNS